MTIADQAKRMGVDERALRRFYKGLGPKPRPKMTIPKPETPQIESSGLSGGIVALGGGWYQVGNARVRGLNRALSWPEGEEE